MPEDPANRWYLEQRFFGADPPHRLRDSFRDYLTRNPDRYAELCATVPANGPLATSYTRGSKSNPIKDRFDYVFISDEFECVDMRHDYDAGLAAGSDHGVISCEVVLA
jgi:endonuclease/exonuclease/phosphatase family metal-dependent hydrolase